MAAAIDVLDPEHPKRVVIVASNPAVSEQTGWRIGFWWSELTHPYWELTEHGYTVDIASPKGGALEADFYAEAVVGAVAPEASAVGEFPDERREVGEPERFRVGVLRCEPEHRRTAGCERQVGVERS